MFDSNPLRHRCRNPRCKVRLKETVENPRDAFCCASCEAGFYRTHCRVCERELGDVRRNSRRELCGRRQCRNQFRSFWHQFFSTWYPNAIGASKPEKSSTQSTPKTVIKSDQTLRVVAGPKPSPSMLRCAGVGSAKAIEANRANAKFAADAALIGPNDPPVNVLGGHRWSNNITIVTLAEIIETEIAGDRFYSAERPTKHTKNPPANPYLDEIPADIPAFLRRRSS